jgi:hypothetical protein
VTFDVDEFLDDYEAPVEQVAVCGKAGLLAEHARLESEIVGHRSGLGGPPSDLVERLAEVEAELERSVKVFTLEALTYQEWSDLMAAHPPSKDQRSQGHGSNPATFEPAALAACASDPPLTVEQAERMRATLPPSEWAALMGAVARLHQERTSAPKSLLLSVVRRMSEGSSTMPQVEGSLGASSSDGSAAQ